MNALNLILIQNEDTSDLMFKQKLTVFENDFNQLLT
jgi:hypothetical protein